MWYDLKTISSGAVDRCRVVVLWLALCCIGQEQTVARLADGLRAGRPFKAISVQSGGQPNITLNPHPLMSFDAFEARLQFLQLLRKLNASAQSIQKVVGFAVKYGSKCGEDLWEVVMDECEKVSRAGREGRHVLCIQSGSCYATYAIYVIDMGHHSVETDCTGRRIELIIGDVKYPDQYPLLSRLPARRLALHRTA